MAHDMFQIIAYFIHLVIFDIFDISEIDSSQISELR